MTEISIHSFSSSNDDDVLLKPKNDTQPDSKPGNQLRLIKQHDEMEKYWTKLKLGGNRLTLMSKKTQGSRNHMPRVGGYLKTEGADDDSHLEQMF